MKFDLHVHSKYSVDCILDPKKIVKTAHKKGLSGVAITDHNTIKGGLETKKYETNDLQVIVGSEIKTDRGEVIGLYLSEEIKPGLFSEVVQKIKDQNGLVILPHPFDGIRGNGIKPGKDDIPHIDCVEVYNSRCLLDKYNHKARIFAQNNDLLMTAGSDAHFTSEIGKAGIITPQEIEDEDDLKQILYRDNFTLYGEKSNIIYLGLTKVLKLWRKTGSG